MKRMMAMLLALALLAALLTGCAAKLPEEDAAQPPQNAERTAAEEVVQPTVEEVDEPAEETRSAQELLDVYLGRDNAPAQAAEELLDYVLQVASGERQTNNEAHNYREISIFKQGVTL